MTEEAGQGSLITAVTAFATELHDLLVAVLPGAPSPFEVVVAGGDDPHIIVRQTPVEGVPLTVDGEPVLRLTARFRCSWDSAKKYLAVRESTLGIRAETSDEPLFRYDYLADCDGKIPAAHLNVHSHRDEVVFAMMVAGLRHRGRSRSAQVRDGKVPRLATLHFPLGGHRFRPSLEDLLEMVVREFGLDTEPTWEDALRKGRARWRDKQLRAAVRDDPASAADILRTLGYGIRDPKTPISPRLDRIEAL